jgi:hypothetical protein
MYLGQKTMVILLETYNKLYESMSNSADKQKIGKLIANLEKEIELESNKEENKSHIRFGTSSYSRAEESFQKDICSCGHKKIDCDCKAGCKCGCNKRFLGAY